MWHEVQSELEEDRRNYLAAKEDLNKAVIVKESLESELAATRQAEQEERNKRAVVEDELMVQVGLLDAIRREFDLGLAVQQENKDTIDIQDARLAQLRETTAMLSEEVYTRKLAARTLGAILVEFGMDLQEPTKMAEALEKKVTMELRTRMEKMKMSHEEELTRLKEQMQTSLDVIGICIL